MPAATPAAAASRSASANTTFGDLPPSSRASRFRLVTERAVMVRPVSVEPVKLIFPTPRWVTSASPAVGPSPATTFTRPGGRPTFASIAEAGLAQRAPVIPGLDLGQLLDMGGDLVRPGAQDHGALHR